MIRIAIRISTFFVAAHGLKQANSFFSFIIPSIPSPLRAISCQYDSFFVDAAVFRICMAPLVASCDAKMGRKRDRFGQFLPTPIAIGLKTWEILEMNILITDVILEFLLKQSLECNKEYLNMVKKMDK
jgi:hypothetical protein